jgi:two-component system nitrogen regulation sensor histidine kinase NtrY
MRRPRIKVGHDLHVLLLAFASGFPAVTVALYFLWHEEGTPILGWTLGLVLVGTWLGLCVSLHGQVVDRLYVLANLLKALREGDFSLRAATHNDPGRALGAVLDEVNAFGGTLQQQRLGALDAAALLSKVMFEIDVAVFAFDDCQRLRLVNRAAEELLGQAAPRVLGETAHALKLDGLLEGEPERTVRAEFAQILRGRWELRRSPFRQGGLEHQLIVLTDLRRALREEQRLAWQRLVRVLGHEINNSLAPISSIASNLRQGLTRHPRPVDLDADLERGLEVVSRRAEALGRFMKAYARVAQLPPPKLAPIRMNAWIRRIAELDRRVEVIVRPGPDFTFLGDADQLDQLLINLVRNAIDAALGGKVTIAWRRSAEQLEVTIADDGPGISDTANLFVPFFTTKPQGSGIGLVLCRQIAEAHGGAVELQNRRDATGSEATLRLPL